MTVTVHIFLYHTGLNNTKPSHWRILQRKTQKCHTRRCQPFSACWYRLSCSMLSTWPPVVVKAEWLIIPEISLAEII